jgi:alkyl sulfatase BDS1-like metallo-beta-lactamase superfamily hydrolase
LNGSFLATIAGLFKVADRVYQVRGNDLSNVSIIEGDSGLLLIDPLISAETAKAALDLYYRHRPKKPVVAVIFTHSHVDHYAGALGVVSADDVAAKRVRIIAPENFLDEAVSENVIAGNAMGRRATASFSKSSASARRNSSPPGVTSNSGSLRASSMASAKSIFASSRFTVFIASPPCRAIG